MGATISIETSNKYTLGRGFKVTISGGKEALKKDIKSGDLLQVELLAKKEPTSIAKNYLVNPKFRNDLASVILKRATTNLMTEYNLALDQSTIKELNWVVEDEPATVEGNKIRFNVKLKVKNARKLYELIAIMAACLAWHTKSSTIPVQEHSENDEVELTGVKFSLVVPAAKKHSSRNRI